MSADRELLAAAARAAGRVIRWDGNVSVLVDFEPGVDDCSAWCPITDDGDNMRLAVRCHLHAARTSASRVGCYGEKAPFDQDGPDNGTANSTWVELAYCWFGASSKATAKRHGWDWEPDQLSATRRAIVRAAASLSKGQP